MRDLLSILGPVMIIYTVYSVVLRKGLRVHLNHAAFTFSRLIHVGSEFTDLSCTRGFVSIASFHSLYSTVAFFELGLLLFHPIVPALHGQYVAIGQRSAWFLR